MQSADGIKDANLKIRRVSWIILVALLLVLKIKEGGHELNNIGGF